MEEPEAHARRDRLPLEIWEGVISTGSGSHTVGDLRAKVEQDRDRLASLNPESTGYRQLRRQVSRESARLREQEEDINRRAGHVRDMRLFAIVLGGIVTVAGWGSWPGVLTGVATALFGAWIVGRLPEHFYR
jgi:hypothetical protein